jgi:hypothetical protein
MAQSVQEVPTELFVREEIPELEHLLETEGYVDGSFAGMQQLILVNAAHGSYTPPPDPSRPGVKRTFWAAADLPVMQDKQTILAPDFLLALDQVRPSHPEEKSYELWNRSAPGLMVEHVSNREGRELGKKMRTYAEWGCRHYVVYDPERRIGRKVLHVFELVNGQYVEMPAPHYFPSLGVGVTLWKDRGTSETFLRLCDECGEVLLTGDEKSERERVRADKADARAERERLKAERERLNAERERQSTQRERVRADQAEALAEQERVHAEQERVRAEQERARAELAEQRVSTVEQVADTAKAEVEALRKILREHGLEGYGSSRPAHD